MPNRLSAVVNGGDVAAGLRTCYLTGGVAFLGFYFGADVLRSRTYPHAGHVPLEAG